MTSGASRSAYFQPTKRTVVVLEPVRSGPRRVCTRGGRRRVMPCREGGRSRCSWPSPRRHSDGRRGPGAADHSARDGSTGSGWSSPSTHELPLIEMTADRSELVPQQDPRGKEGVARLTAGAAHQGPPANRSADELGGARSNRSVARIDAGPGTDGTIVGAEFLRQGLSPRVSISSARCCSTDLRARRGPSGARGAGGWPGRHRLEDTSAGRRESATPAGSTGAHSLRAAAGRPDGHRPAPRPRATSPTSNERWYPCPRQHVSSSWSAYLTASDAVIRLREAFGRLAAPLARRRLGSGPAPGAGPRCAACSWLTSRTRRRRRCRFGNIAIARNDRALSFPPRSPTRSSAVASPQS